MSYFKYNEKLEDSQLHFCLKRKFEIGWFEKSSVLWKFYVDLLSRNETLFLSDRWLVIK